MKTMKIVAGAALIGVLFLSASFIMDRSGDAEKTQQPADNGFAVVELFTSEGCSSCPPADALIKQLQQQNQQQLYILSYHVDYWDHQGWKDRFSDKAYSQRQLQYASWLNVESVYTPQLIVNGVSEHIGSDQHAVSKAIAEQVQSGLTPTLKLQATIDGNQLSITNNSTSDVNAELIIALVQKKAESKVEAGENTGRDLSHVQVVRMLKYVATGDKGIAEMQIPKGFEKNGWELIGFVQNKKTGRITDAARFSFYK